MNETKYQSGESVCFGWCRAQEQSSTFAIDNLVSEQNNKLTKNGKKQNANQKKAPNQGIKHGLLHRETEKGYYPSKNNNVSPVTHSIDDAYIPVEFLFLPNHRHSLRHCHWQNVSCRTGQK